MWALPTATAISRFRKTAPMIVSAAALPEDLYPYAEGGEQFQRTISRLTEMQTRGYLGEPHLP